MVAAIEAADTDGVLARIDPSFGDTYGTTYEQLRPIIEEAFGRYSDIRFSFDDVSAREGDGVATVEMQFRVLVSYQGVRGFALGSLREAQQAVIDLRKGDDGVYRVTGVRGVGKLSRAIRGEGRGS